MALKYKTVFKKNNESIASQIRDLLVREGALSIKDIAQKMGVSEATVKQSVYGLAYQKKIMPYGISRNKTYGPLLKPKQEAPKTPQEAPQQEPLKTADLKTMSVEEFRLIFRAVNAEAEKRFFEFEDLRKKLTQLGGRR